MRGELRKDLVGDTSAHEAGAFTAIGRAAKAALLSRASLVATAIALVLALSWGLAAFLAVPAVFMVGLAGRLLALRSRALRGRPERPISLPDPLMFGDAAAQTAVRRMAQARENLERAIVDSPRGDAFELANVAKGASQLERRVLVLAARAEYLGSFLASVSAAELRNELERVRVRERGALAPDARQTYARVVRRTEEHIQALAALEAEKDRLAAKLDYMVGTLEALPAKVTRVQFLRLGYVDADLSPEAMEDAARVFDDVGALEDAFAIDVDAPVGHDPAWNTNGKLTSTGASVGGGKRQRAISPRTQAATSAAPSVSSSTATATTVPAEAIENRTTNLPPSAGFDFSARS
jgi:hypothetical protein